MSPAQIAKDNARVEARLDKLLNILPALVYRCRILDNYQYVLEYASKGSEALLGLKPAELTLGGTNFIERMTHPADILRLREAVREGIDSHMPWEVMYRVILPGNVVKWVWDQGETIYSEAGKPLYLEGLMMDISGQKFLELALQEENRQLKRQLESAEGLGDFVGKSEAMRKVYRLILKAAETDTNIIIHGETGSGKDVAARAIHAYSGRKGAYVPVNCAALPENLMESEFFGYTRGAFTGAGAAKEGFLAAANNGTLFLDEIGEMPLNLQVKFLRALESKSFTPLGANKPKSSNFRLVSATNRDLAALVRAGKMRPDFYYRINVLTIHLPPLRERIEDLPLLIKAWEERHNAKLNLSRKAKLAMNQYDWPGNIRELQNFLDRYTTFGEVAVDSLVALNAVSDIALDQPLDEAIRQLETNMILAALEKAHWRIGKCAELLGLNLRTLQRKMKVLGIRDNSN